MQDTQIYAIYRLKTDLLCHSSFVGKMLCCVFEEVCLSIKIVYDIVYMNIVYDVVYDVVYDIVYDIVYDVNMIPVGFCLKNNDCRC